MDKIYTKIGDKGFTTNLLNKRYSKADVEMELQGGIDEINANVGFLRSIIKLNETDSFQSDKEDIDYMLKKVQYHLYLIGVEISTEFTETYITDDEIHIIENAIDFMVSKTEPMTSFIYYSGNQQASYCHIIRTITRRVERVFVRTLSDKQFPKSYEYVNRLSDYFFTLSRYVNQLNGLMDEPLKLR